MTPLSSVPLAPRGLGKIVEQEQLRLLRAHYLARLHLHQQKQHQLSLLRRTRKARQSKRNQRHSSPGATAVDAQDQMDALELERRRGERTAGVGGIDGKHGLQLGYQLDPNQSADIYYHGHHPPPPAKVVHALLALTRLPPFFDPAHLTTDQLAAVVEPILGTIPKAGEEEDIWEREMIAAFSTGCDERIGRGGLTREISGFSGMGGKMEGVGGGSKGRSYYPTASTSSNSMIEGSSLDQASYNARPPPLTSSSSSSSNPSSLLPHQVQQSQLPQHIHHSIGAHPQQQQQQQQQQREMQQQQQQMQQQQLMRERDREGGYLPQQQQQQQQQHWR